MKYLIERIKILLALITASIGCIMGLAIWVTGTFIVVSSLMNFFWTLSQ